MLRFSPAGYTACIRFAIPDGTVEIHIQPDPEPPTWLGRFSRHRVPGAVRMALAGRILAGLLSKAMGPESSDS